MALSQKSASYARRAQITDQHLRAALDDIASQIDAVNREVKTSKAGQAQAPSTPASLNVLSQNGFASVSIQHNNPAAGTEYVVEYSTAANFSQNVIRVDNGISRTWGAYLKGQVFYFRAAARFPVANAPLTPWVYYGSQANPTPVSF